MEIEVKNVAALSEATVEIAGITLIAGENNTGKSTIGKALFALFNGLKHLDENITKIKIELVNQFISERVQKKENVVLYDAQELALELIDKARSKGDIVTMANKEFASLEYNDILTDSDIDKLADIIINNKYYRDLKYAVLSKAIAGEFSRKVNNIQSYQEHGYISLRVGEKSTKFDIFKDKVVDVENDRKLDYQPIYLDEEVSFALELNNPFIAERVFPERVVQTLHAFFSSHRKEIKEAVIGDIQKEKIDSILDRLSKFSGGKIKKNRSSVSFVSDQSDSFELPLNSVSSGLKLLIILRELIENGSISNKGTLILDEPEIHLHPQWQVSLAEILVVLQKELNLHLLITTHSPYFVSAIDVYSKKYNIVENNRYYFSERHGSIVKIRNVTKEISVIFDSLAAPYQTIQDQAMELEK